jgi:hypothetical protein
VTGAAGGFVDFADERRDEGACFAGGKVKAETLAGGGLVDKVADRAEGGGDGST